MSNFAVKFKPTQNYKDMAKKKEQSEVRKALVRAVGKYAGMTKQTQPYVWKYLYRQLWKEEGIDLRVIPNDTKGQTLLDKAEKYGYMYMLLDMITAMNVFVAEEIRERKQRERMINQS